MRSAVDVSVHTLAMFPSHGHFIALLPQRHKPGHLVPQKDDLEFREPGRDMLAALDALLERQEAQTHILVVFSLLELNGGQLVANGSHPLIFFVVAAVALVTVAID